MWKNNEKKNYKSERDGPRRYHCSPIGNYTHVGTRCPDDRILYDIIYVRPCTTAARRILLSLQVFFFLYFFPFLFPLTKKKTRTNHCRRCCIGRKDLRTVNNRTGDPTDPRYSFSAGRPTNFCSPGRARDDDDIVFDRNDNNSFSTGRV